MRQLLGRFVFVVFLIGSAGAAAADTLTDALRQAYKHSGLLEQNRALLRAADEDVAVAVAALYPVVSYLARASYNNVEGVDSDSTLLQITASLNLYDGGRNQLAIDAAKENVLALREALIGVEQQVLQRAVAAYMNVIRASQFVNLRQNNVRVITQELRAARDRFEVGEVTRTDVSIAEARLAAARSGLAAAAGDLASAREEYRAAVGRYPQSLRNPPRPRSAAKSLEAAQAVALKRHPDLRRAQRDIKVAELNAERARRAVMPSVDLGATAQNSSGTDSFGLNLSVSGPIYQGGRLSAQTRQAVARVEAGRANLHVVSHSIRQNAADAYSQLVVARASLDASNRQVRAQRVAFRGTREEASLGARTTLDVLNAEQELLDAEANVISAQADEYIAAYALLAAMGLLTVEELRLGIQTYDPAAYYNAVKDAPVSSKQGQALDRVIKSLGKQ